MPIGPDVTRCQDHISGSMGRHLGAATAKALELPVVERRLSLVRNCRFTLESVQRHPCREQHVNPDIVVRSAANACFPRNFERGTTSALAICTDRSSVRTVSSVLIGRSSGLHACHLSVGGSVARSSRRILPVCRNATEILR